MDMESFRSKLDKKKRVTANGVEYWMGRDIQEILGYDTWQYFEQAIERAKTACESAGKNPKDWFRDTTKPIKSGKGGIQKRGDCYLSRFACYLIAMNGDSTKSEIGWAQTYFAVQTRRQEMSDEINAKLARLDKRNTVALHNSQLAGVAKRSGVQRFGLFQDFGYRGLYGMPLKAIKAKKRIPDKDHLLDYAGIAELSAIDFKSTQTTAALHRLSIHNEHAANALHEKVGKIVREAMRQANEIMPEDLPTEPHIKIIKQELKTAKVLPSKQDETN
ncbi:MAG: DNA damage-inducible protein D [Blastocatellia bacterium]